MKTPTVCYADTFLRALTSRRSVTNNLPPLQIN
jgi:hypothetical protein